MISNITPNYRFIFNEFGLEPKRKSRPKKIINTQEKKRGMTFVVKFKLLKILLDNDLSRIYDKETLTKLYFKTKKTNPTQRKYVYRIMNMFSLINIVDCCDELGKPIKAKTRVKKNYWRLNKNALKNLGVK